MKEQLEVGDKILNTNDFYSHILELVRVTKTKAICKYPSGTLIDVNRKLSSIGTTERKGAWRWDSNRYKLIEK